VGKEYGVAGNKRPSFLKRQKEQARAARATEKREAKRLKKERKAAGIIDPADDEFGDKSDYESGIADEPEEAETTEG